MKTRIVRTHENGRRRADRQIERDTPAEGELRVHTQMHRELKREVMMATVCLNHGLPNEKALLPPLYEPQLLTLGNNAMMLCGFEEIDGRRMYQGWWIRFVEE